MTKKQKVIESILSQMKSEGISLKDLERADENPPVFDLLCIIDEKMVRIPFKQKNKGYVMGIFFSSENRDLYLEVDETMEGLRRFAHENRLPELSQWENIFNHRNELNRVLEALNKPQLEGFYFARQNHLNWIVGMDAAEGQAMPSDYYDDNEKAKIRYVGTFNG